MNLHRHDITVIAELDKEKKRSYIYNAL